MVALDCRTAVELVSGYLDHDLDADSQRRFVAHVAGCDGCGRYVDQVSQTVRLLGRLPSPHPGSER
jgi:predicted anti-sigma-YlaC factor YlaD